MLLLQGRSSSTPTSASNKVRTKVTWWYSPHCGVDRLFIWLITHCVICLTTSSTYSIRGINVTCNWTCFFGICGRDLLIHYNTVYFAAHTTQTGFRSLWYSNTANYWWLFLPSTWIITTQARDLYINAIMSLEIGHISTYLLKACDTHFSSHLPEVCSASMEYC